MTKSIKVTIRDISPLLMNRYCGEQPSAAKPPRGKKTQEWIDQERKRHWLKAAHFDESGKLFHIPPEAFRNAADETGRHLNGDHYVPEHIDIRGVVIGKVRVDRCRPIFRDWGVEFTVVYDTDRVEYNHVYEALTEAGAYIGLLDFRPRYGRFRVTAFNEI